jgi:hypothetical protein
MVQILPRTQLTFGEQVASGIGKGVEQGTEFAKMFAKQKMEQRQRLAEDTKKADLADKYKDAFIQQGASPQIAELLAAEIAGQVSGGSAKSAINAFRDQEENSFLSNILGKNSQSSNMQSGNNNIEGGTDAEQGLSLWKNLDSNEKALFAHKYPDVAKQFQAEETTKQSQYNVEREFQYKRAKPTLDRAENLRLSLPKQKMVREGVEEAAKSGKLGLFSLNNLADITGIDGLRDPNGAQFKSGIKEYFIGDVGGLGSVRLNQWLEKTMYDALPKMAYDESSNLTILAGTKYKEDIDQKWLDTENQLEDFYEKNNDGIIPGSIGRKIEEMMHPYVEERQKQLKQEVENIKKTAQPKNLVKGARRTPKGYIYMVNPETGEELNVLNKDVREAMTEGFEARK